MNFKNIIILLAIVCLGAFLLQHYRSQQQTNIKIQGFNKDLYKFGQGFLG